MNEDTIQIGELVKVSFTRDFMHVTGKLVGFDSNGVLLTVDGVPYFIPYPAFLYMKRATGKDKDE